MLVTKLAGQALRPKRIGSLTLPLAAFGDRSNEAFDGAHAPMARVTLDIFI